MFYHAKKEASHPKTAPAAKTQIANNQKKHTQEAYKIGQFIKTKSTNKKYILILDYNQQATGIIHPKEIRKWLNGSKTK